MKCHNGVRVVHFLIILFLIGHIVYAQVAYETLLEPNEIGFSEPQYTQVSSHCFDGDIAYVINYGVESVITPIWEVKITKVSDICGNPSPATLVNNAAWMAFTNEEYGYSMPGNRLSIVDGYLQYVDHALESVIRVHNITGEISYFVTQANITALTGQADASLTGENAFNPIDQTMAFYDERSDCVLQVTSDGVLSIFISKAELQNAMNANYTNFISGGMDFDKDGNFYWTSSRSGSSGNGCIYRRTTDGVFSKIITENEIREMTPTSVYSAVAFNDLYAAPDGYLYFYDRRQDVDAIMCFAPDEPNNLTIFLTRSELIDGPAQIDNIDVFNHYGPFLSFSIIGNTSRLGQGIYGKYLAGFPQTQQEVHELGYTLSGDWNQDCRVNNEDLLLLADEWLVSKDLADFSLMAQNWMLCNIPLDNSCVENWLP